MSKPKTTAAIPTDAPAAPEATQQEDPRPSREESMKQAAARRRESIANEMDGPYKEAYLAGQKEPEPAPEPEPEPEIDAKAQVEIQRAEPTILNEEDLARYAVRTKVNGQESIEPLDQIRAGYQKNTAADRYLAEAKQIHAEMKQMLAQQPAPAAPAEPPKATPAEEDPTEVAKKVVASMFSGDDNGATEALATILKGRTVAATPPPVDVEQITRHVMTRFTEERALHQFAEEHPEIIKDDMLRRVADTFILEETGGVPLSQLPPEKIPAVMKNVGERTNTWLSKIRGTAPTQDATTRDEKRRAKAGIDEPPAAAARAASTVPTPKTPSDVIADMAAKRGQGYAGRGS